MNGEFARVLDSRDRELSPCPVSRARKMVAEGRAEVTAEDPLTIRLPYAVDVPLPTQQITVEPDVGRKLLLHICCSPCSTYPIRWLRDNGYAVTGLWYNPNVQPFGEHEARRGSMSRLAETLGLDVVWAERYEMPRFMRLISGHERFRERCRLCYLMRLERTAQTAAERGFDWFTTTLLISVHQDQSAIRDIGEEVGRRFGVRFLFENFRRGWSERGRLAREYGLYMQQYCGCIYSEWERYDKQARESLPQRDF